MKWKYFCWGRYLYLEWHFFSQPWGYHWSRKPAQDRDKRCICTATSSSPAANHPEKPLQGDSGVSLRPHPSARVLVELPVCIPTSSCSPKPAPALKTTQVLNLPFISTPALSEGARTDLLSNWRPTHNLIAVLMTKLKTGMQPRYQQPTLGRALICSETQNYQ